MFFKDIVFGKAAAEKERSDLPHLLNDGFLDAHGYIDEIIKGDKFLILGPKGSGKSAIGSKLELLSEDKDFYTKQYYLGSFPFKPFSEIIPGKEAPETRFPDHWEFVLLIAALNSFMLDDSCKFIQNKRFVEIMKAFQNLGILPSENLTQIVKKTSDKKFKIGLKNIVSAEKVSDDEKIPFDIKMLFNTLKDVCYSLKMISKHLIIIDGLDDVLTYRSNQYTSLSALILAAERMNNKFKQNHIKAQIIILCRTDLFDKLSGSNINKTIRDSGITLNWYQDLTNYKSTNLIKLINLRAKISLNQNIDIFDEFFPPEFSGKDTAKALLESTRHTPRDLIQLVNEIQKHTRSGNPSKSNISNGLRTYSIDYFVGEIKDELYGLLDREEIDQIIELLGINGKARFNIQDLERIKAKDNRFSSIDLNKALTLLFNCSAIGNVQGKYLTFRYRNRHASVNFNDDFLIHSGLRKGINVG